MSDTSPTHTPELFDALVEASGLDRLVAPFTMSRLLIRADVSGRDLTPEDLARALPEIEKGLAVFLRGEDLERAVAAVRALARN